MPPCTTTARGGAQTVLPRTLRGARAVGAGVLLWLAALPALAGELEALVMPGKVIEGHADIEKDCRKCHVPFRKSKQVELCLGCHEDVAKDVSLRSGYHGRLDRGRACSDCHSEHKGRSADIVGLDKSSFDHSLTDYVLLGLHTKVKCAACHVAGKKYREAPTACVSCHLKDDVHRNKFGSSCDNCHTASGWKKATFDHSKTRFPLRASHGSVRCRDCHKSPKFDDKPPRTCAECHRKDDVHKGKFGSKCESCHSESKWKSVHFDHERDARFALRAAHFRARCTACHKAPLYTDKLPTTCIGCHRKDDAHKGEFGTKCASCHSEDRWKQIIFDHDRETKFPLRSAHRQIKCKACHNGPLYETKPPATCNGCHAKDDVHRGRLGKRCDTCHTEADWKASRFDHSRHTDYPLRGKHASVKCKACHVDNTFRQQLNTACLSCHRKDDVHKGQQGKRCESCHSENSWKNARFDHSKARFVLLGSHLKVKCNSCHKSQRFKDAPMQCVGCHRKDDAHKGRLGAACDTCHNARDWRIWDFDHDRETGFVIDGAHSKLACVSCHTRPGKTVHTAGRRCVDCHDRDDVHRGGFGTECARCHFTSNFRDLRSGARSRAR